MLPGAACLLLFFWAAGLLASPAAITVLGENITTTVGESVLFPNRPFAEISEWVFLGAQRTNAAGKDLMFYHHNPHVFKAYEGRIQPRHGTFLLLNVSRQDEGWYCQTRDLQNVSYCYIRVLDPVCNVSVVATQSENEVFLHCRFTGKAVTIVWSHNGNNVPASQLLSGNHSLQIPSEEAIGYVQCSVMCGERGWQHAVYNFTIDDTAAVFNHSDVKKRSTDNQWSSYETLRKHDGTTSDNMQGVTEDQRPLEQFTPGFNWAHKCYCASQF